MVNRMLVGNSKKDLHLHRSMARLGLVAVKPRLLEEIETMLKGKH